MKTNTTARAKLNLCLHVTGQREDGFHLIQSLVCFADYGDDISVEASAQTSLTIDGEFGAGLPASDNLMLHAVKAAGMSDGFALGLTKNLPVASGMGGGSADAAAVWRVLVDVFGAEVPTIDQLCDLGADLAMCFDSEPAWVGGIGDELTPLDKFPALSAVLINPLEPLSTPQVFGALDQKDNPAISDRPDWFDDADALFGFLDETRNDLAAPARAILPAIGVMLDALSDHGARIARMSGSGASCFGLYHTRSQAEAAADSLALAHPNWWVKPVSISGV